MNFLMIFPLPAQWVPFALMIMQYLSGGSILGSLIGIASGHIVFYLLYILPVIIGREVLKTPAFLSRWLDDPLPGQVPEPQRPNGQRGFPQGQGRRIGD
jgi:hypothetical protein